MDIALVGLLVVGSVVLFVSEVFRVDIVALMVLSAVMACGLASPAEALAGFSNPATITVAAMFVLSAGLDRTGTLNPLSDWIAKLIRTKGTVISLFALTAVTGLVSAFINNTAAVAIFLPAVMSATKEAKVSPSRFLLPLSFVSMAGGTITLIGTSTNLLVNSVAVSHGIREFGFFEFAPLGFVLLAASLLYSITLGLRLTPERRRPQDLTEEFEMGSFISNLSVNPEGNTVRHTLKDSGLKSVKGDILTLKRQNVERKPSENEVLESDDALVMRTEEPEQLEKVRDEIGVSVGYQKLRDRDLEGDQAILIEATVSSSAEGSTLRARDVKKTFDAVPLAMSRRGTLTHKKLEDLPLRSGDTILFQVERDRVDQLRLAGTFLVLSQEEKQVRPRHALGAVFIVLGVVLAAAFNVTPIVVSATIGALVMVLSGCLNTEDAYRAIDWKVIFLLAGMLSLGSAMETTGAASVFSEAILEGIRHLGPQAVLGVLYVVTTLLTAGMSNNATAALLAPVAIFMAHSMEVSPRPFLVAVAFAASACFTSPIGYQTNLMVYGPGRFKFIDFIKVGGPLNLIFLLISVFLIPLIWKF